MSEPEYYQLKPVMPAKGEFFVTAAFIDCQFCKNSISGMGGPDYSAVCRACVDKFAQPTNSGSGE